LDEDANIRDRAHGSGRIAKRFSDGWKDDGFFGGRQAPRQRHVKAPFGKDVRVAPGGKIFALARAKFFWLTAGDLSFGCGRAMWIKGGDGTIG
jgi:hypothetical protein